MLSIKAYFDIIKPCSKNLASIFCGLCFLSGLCFLELYGKSIFHTPKTCHFLVALFPHYTITYSNTSLALFSPSEKLEELLLLYYKHVGKSRVYGWIKGAAVCCAHAVFERGRALQTSFTTSTAISSWLLTGVEITTDLHIYLYNTYLVPSALLLLLDSFKLVVTYGQDLVF